jgi:hypothetical protein
MRHPPPPRFSSSGAAVLFVGLTRFNRPKYLELTARAVVCGTAMENTTDTVETLATELAINPETLREKMLELAVKAIRWNITAGIDPFYTLDLRDLEQP